MSLFCNLVGKRFFAFSQKSQNIMASIADFLGAYCKYENKKI